MYIYFVPSLSLALYDFSVTSIECGSFIWNVVAYMELHTDSAMWYSIWNDGSFVVCEWFLLDWWLQLAGSKVTSFLPGYWIPGYLVTYWLSGRWEVKQCRYEPHPIRVWVPYKHPRVQCNYAWMGSVVQAWTGATASRITQVNLKQCLEQRWLRLHVMKTCAWPATNKWGVSTLLLNDTPLTHIY